MDKAAHTIISLDVNGDNYRIRVDHRWTLLRVLRDSLDLTGAKRGCDRGECGACTVILDGKSVYACQILVMQVGQRKVRTIEGIGTLANLHPIQQAFLDNDGAQCGYCSPGFILATKALLDSTIAPSEDQIKRALSGVICRCAAYSRIIESAKASIETLDEKSVNSTG